MSSEVGTAADSGVVVRAVSEEDRASWRALYRGYRDFYKAPHSDEAIDTVAEQATSAGARASKLVGREIEEGEDFVSTTVDKVADAAKRAVAAAQPK